MRLVMYRSRACMLATVTRAACTTSGAPLEGPRCPEISRQALYLRTFEIYCTSEQTTTRTAVVHVQVVHTHTHTQRDTHREGKRIDVSMYSASKKRDGPRAHTHSRSPTHRHRHAHKHTPPTSYYTDGHILGFTIGSPHHETTTACAHSRLRSTCCSRLDCNSTQCVTVCCVLSAACCVYSLCCVHRKCAVRRGH